MEACLCAYVPKSEESQTETNETYQSIEIETTQESKESEGEDISRFSEAAFNTQETENYKHEEIEGNKSVLAVCASDSSDSTTTASQVLAVEARKWQLKHELTEAEESIRCLEQVLREQWSIGNKTCYDTQKVKQEKSKLVIEMQKQFTTHVNERNKLVWDITAARQNNMLIAQEIKAAEMKNKKLKLERNETSACLYKTTVELYRRSGTLETTTAIPNNSSEVDSEDESQATEHGSSDSSNPSSCAEKSLSETTPSTACSTLEISSSTDYGPQSSTDETSASESSSSQFKSESTNVTFFESKMPANEIRLDLSFVEKEKLLNLDSGFSEATNLATQSSITTIRIIDATTPNILE